MSDTRETAEVHHEVSALRRLCGALALSAHVLHRDPDQLAGQLTGRLVRFENAALRRFLERASRRGRRWLRPTTPSLIPPGGALLRTLVGHTKSVVAISLAPDARRFVSASEDGTLRVWEVESGRELAVLVSMAAGPGGTPGCLAITPSGRRLLSIAADGTAQLWDLESGRQETTLGSQTTATAVSADGRLAVTGSQDGAVHVWSLESGKLLTTLQEDSHAVQAVALSPDGWRVVTGSRDGTVRIWSLEAGQLTAELRGHTDSVWVVKVTPDAKAVVSGSDDRTVRVWDLDTGQNRAVLKGHRLPVKALDITPDARIAVTGSDGYLPDYGDDDDEGVAYALSSGMRMWDLRRCQQVAGMEEEFGRGGAVAVTSGKTAAFRGDTLFVWGLDTPGEAASLRAPSEFRALDVTPHAPRAISGHSDGTLRLWNLDGDPKISATGHSTRVVAVSVIPDGRAVSAARNGTLKTWDLRAGCELTTLTCHGSSVVDMAVTRDGLALVATWDGPLTVWNLNSGAKLTSMEDPVGVPVLARAVAVTPDGRIAVCGYDYRKSTVRGGFLTVWDLPSARQLRALRGHTAWVSAVVVTPDGRRAVSGGEDNTVRLWDLRSGRMRANLEGHTDVVKAVALSRDNKRVLSASRDGTLRVWSRRRRSQLSLLRTTGPLSGLAVSPDGRLAASAGTFLQVWHLATETELTRFLADASFTSCAFAPDGDSLVAGDEAGCVHILRLEAMGSRA